MKRSRNKEKSDGVIPMLVCFFLLYLFAKTLANMQ